MQRTRFGSGAVRDVQQVGERFPRNHVRARASRHPRPAVPGVEQDGFTSVVEDEGVSADGAADRPLLPARPALKIRRGGIGNERLPVPVPHVEHIVEASSPIHERGPDVPALPRAFADRQGHGMPDPMAVVRRAGMAEGNFIPRDPANFARASVNMEDVQAPVIDH